MGFLMDANPDKIAVFFVFGAGVVPGCPQKPSESETAALNAAHME
ncbi:MAG: hypothetical protein ACLTGJ_02510 [Faecalibacterium prausnitzii]